MRQVVFSLRKTYNSGAPHQVDVVSFDLLLKRKKFRYIHSPLQQFRMYTVHIELLHYFVLIQPLHQYSKEMFGGGGQKGNGVST